MRLILDCDNTMGVPGCDADDALALLYLLGTPHIEVVGITTTHGNAPVDVVYKNTRKLLSELGREDIPCYLGGGGVQERHSEAAEFLAHCTRTDPGKVAVLATGAQTNLLGAAEYAPGFWDNVQSFSLMGGLTEPLFVGGKPMAELNFSCDPKASLAVVTCGRPVGISTGPNCLPAYFSRAETHQRLSKAGNVGAYIDRSLQYWFDHNKMYWNQDGFVNWDVVAAAWLAAPELFHAERTAITPTLHSMERGLLLDEGEPHMVTLPRIRDEGAFRADVFQRWSCANVDITAI